MAGLEGEGKLIFLSFQEWRSLKVYRQLWELWMKSSMADAAWLYSVVIRGRLKGACRSDKQQILLRMSMFFSNVIALVVGAINSGVHRALKQQEISQVLCWVEVHTNVGVQEIYKAALGQTMSLLKLPISYSLWCCLLMVQLEFPLISLLMLLF